MGNENYKEYAKWKGWVYSIPFGSLTSQNRQKYKLQLDRCKVRYQNINALEIGFGNGGFLRFMADNNSHAEGVEVQDELIKCALQQGFMAVNRIEDVSNAPYDLIVAFDVLEHLSIEDLKRFFESASQLLKGDGVMLFRFPNGDSLMGLNSFNGDYTHLTAIGKSKLQQLVEPYGLWIEAFEGAVIFPMSLAQRFVHRPFQYIFRKLLGLPGNYYFSGDVIALVGKGNAFRMQGN